MSENVEKNREAELWLRAKESDGIGRAESYHELSKIEYERENFSDALSMCLVAKEIYESTNANDYSREILDLYEGMANIYEGLKECETAEKTLQDAVALARQNDARNLGDLLRALGRMYFDHEKWEESIAAHLEANRIPAIDDYEIKTRAIDYLNIGMAYFRQDDFAEAVQNERKAMEMFTEEKAAPPWIINTHAELAASYAGLEKPDQVLFHAQIALDWFETEGEHRQVWAMKFYKGVAYRLKGDYETALELLKQARKLAKRYSKTFNVFAAEIDKEIGEIYISHGKVNQGLELVRRAESVQKSIDRDHPTELSEAV